MSDANATDNAVFQITWKGWVFLIVLSLMLVSALAGFSVWSLLHTEATDSTITSNESPVVSVDENRPWAETITPDTPIIEPQLTSSALHIMQDAAFGPTAPKVIVLMFEAHAQVDESTWSGVRCVGERVYAKLTVSCVQAYALSSPELKVFVEEYR